MTVMQVLNAMDGYYEKESDLAKALRVLIWSPVRWLAWRLVNMSGKVMKQPIDRPELMIHFDWDVVSTPKAEDVENLNNIFPDKFGS
jgi:hypothetical protein